MTCDRSVVFSGSSTNKADYNDITEILLKVPLNTIKQTNKQTYLIRPFTLTLIRFDARLHKSRKKENKKNKTKINKKKNKTKKNQNKYKQNKTPQENQTQTKTKTKNKAKIQTLDILTTGIFVFSP